MWKTKLKRILKDDAPKNLYKVKQNRYGNPIILARVILSKPIELNKEICLEVHLQASLDNIQITLRGEDVVPLSSSALWENINKRIETKFSLEREVINIINSFKDGKIPNFLPRFVATRFGGILV